MTKLEVHGQTGQGTYKRKDMDLTEDKKDRSGAPEECPTGSY